MLEEKTKKLLRKSGWYEGRKIDITKKVKLLEEAGYEVFDAAKKFFEEFGELEFILEYESRGKIREDIHTTKFQDLNYSHKKCFNYDEKVGEKTIPVCYLYDGEYTVCISESGGFFIDQGMWAEEKDGFWNGLLGAYKGGFLNWINYKKGKEFKKSQYKNKDYLILEGLPSKWIELLNKMPELKKQMEIDKLNNKDEIISPYFFSYFQNNYEECKEFFLCCEEGANVFKNFNELYGKSNEVIDKLSEEQIINLAKEHLTGINNILSSADEVPYDIEDMEIKICSESEFKEDFDWDDVENGDTERLCNQIVRHSVKESFLANMEEPLYQLSENYNLIYYILWPISPYKNFDNPYKAYVELWKRNLKPIIVDYELLVVLV